MVPATPTWSGCHTNAHGSSCAAPRVVPTASRRWSSQCCCVHGTHHCSAVTSRSDLKREPLVLDSTAHDQPIQRQIDRRWRCSSNRSANANTDPLELALHDAQDDLRGMDDLVSVMTMLGWLDQPNWFRASWRCCSRYVKTVSALTTLRSIPAVGESLMRSGHNSTPNPIDTNSGGTSHIGTWQDSAVALVFGIMLVISTAPNHSEETAQHQEQWWCYPDQSKG